MKFFKILTPGFRTKLNLPHHFCKKAMGDFSTEAVVVTRSGNWMIKSGNKRGRFYFHGNEWIKFVNRHKLEEGCFVLLEHQGSFLFHASIFDASGCEKLEFQSDSEATSDDETSGATANPTPRRRFANPTFRRILKAGSGCDVENIDNSRLYIPTKIWRPNNLQHKTKAILRISGLETKEWKAKLAF
ncbi:hypothetical protein ACS0TY_013297 [Phlomoides rotata]